MKLNSWSTFNCQYGNKSFEFNYFIGGSTKISTPLNIAGYIVVAIHMVNSNEAPMIGFDCIGFWFISLKLY